MKDGTYNVGLIGYGGMASWHRETIDTIDGLEICGVYDIDTKALARANELGLTCFTDLEELLALPQMDFVLIAVPNDCHMELSIKAMRAGKAVVCEKPVTLNSKELQKIREVSEETGMFFTVHQNRRWDEDYLTIQKVMEEGKLGEMYRIESRVHGSRGIPGDWRGEKEHGGGMVLDWGVHLLDQMLLLMKGHKCTSVYATVTNVTNQLVDDGFFAELTFDHGVTTCVEVGTSNFISLPRWYVLGQNGTAVIEDWDMKGKIVRANGADEKDVVPVKTAAGLTKTMAPRRDDSIFTEELPKVKSDIRDFYRNVMGCLDGTQESKIKLDEVARVMRLMETIFASADQKQVIAFE